MGIELPITVEKIEFEEDSELITKGWSCETGALVSIRPCGDEYGGKTYLGIYLGDIARSVGVKFKDGVLKPFHTFHNPAIFVPDLKKTIFGCESWWGEIKSEEQLKQITNEDIENVWYVRLLKKFEEKTEQ